MEQNTKKHLAHSGVVIHNEQEAKSVMAISKVFDLILGDKK